MRWPPLTLGGSQAASCRGQVPTLCSSSLADSIVGLEQTLRGIYDDESKLISGHVLFPLGSGVCLGTFESWVWMCFNVNNRITGILYGAFLRGEKNNERM